MAEELYAESMYLETTAEKLADATALFQRLILNGAEYSLVEDAYDTIRHYALKCCSIASSIDTSAWCKKCSYYVLLDMEKQYGG